MHKHWIKVLVLFLLISVVEVNGQEFNSTEIAVQQINQLRNGLLLVQLDSKQTEIFILKKQGRKAMAEALKKEQYLKNKEICYAFNSYFDFCPVFYFYKAYATELRNQNFDKVVVLDETLEPAYKVDLSDENYWISELGFNAPNVAKCDLQPIDYKGFSGLFILDNNFVQLNPPFPFAVKERKFLLFKKDAFTMVEQWNDVLHTFLAVSQLND